MKRTRWSDVSVESISEDAQTITYQHTEASLNLALATYAHMHGWHVEREVVIPGWGRLDLLVTSGSGFWMRPIEIKLALTKPAAIRKAFQQADGYGRWLEDHGYRILPVMLCAPDGAFDPNAVDEVARLYLDVQATSVGRVMSWLSNPAFSDDYDIVSQRGLALERVRDAEAELVRRRAALANLPMVPLPEPEPTDEEVGA